MGTEVKALRMGRASLVDAWVEINGGEAWLYGANIPLYSQGSWTNHAPTRKRKLLLHRAEINRMQDRVAAKGYTIVPLELYFIGGRVKVEIALAKGKQEWDKRQALREKQDQREAERAMRRYVVPLLLPHYFRVHPRRHMPHLCTNIRNMPSAHVCVPVWQMAWAVWFRITWAECFRPRKGRLKKY